MMKIEMRLITITLSAVKFGCLLCKMKVDSDLTNEGEAWNGFAVCHHIWLAAVSSWQGGKWKDDVNCEVKYRFSGRNG